MLFRNSAMLTERPRILRRSCFDQSGNSGRATPAVGFGLTSHQSEDAAGVGNVCEHLPGIKVLWDSVGEGQGR